MSKTFLYRQISEVIRQEILRQSLHPGDRLPSVREMAERWNCTIGTVQRAYEELVREGIVVSRPGQGTHVAAVTPLEKSEPLRRANLVHRAESFLLEVLNAGYTQSEVEQAVRVALDRWRAIKQDSSSWPEQLLRFVGSHDPAMALITTLFAEVASNYLLQLSFTGSLGGLMALAEGKADLAGIHLWDEKSDSYNLPFVQRLLPNREVVLLTLAHRRLGLVTMPPNAANLTTLEGLLKPGVKFINRQQGAGTRIWLDARLRQLQLDAHKISGYTTEAQTHSEVVSAIVENRADVGVAVESAALTYGMHFVLLTTERYDLVIPAEVWERPPIQALARWLNTDRAKQKIMALGGYTIDETGNLEWVNG